MKPNIEYELKRFLLYIAIETKLMPTFVDTCEAYVLTGNLLLWDDFDIFYTS